MHRLAAVGAKGRNGWTRLSERSEAKVLPDGNVLPTCRLDTRWTPEERQRRLEEHDRLTREFRATTVRQQLSLVSALAPRRVPRRLDRRLGCGRPARRPTSRATASRGDPSDLDEPPRSPAAPLGVAG
jgi:hypothetical protein